MSEQKYPVQNPANPARVIEGEAVVITPEDSQLHSLNDVGTFIWERADGTRTVDQIVEDVCQFFAVDRAQAARDVTEFVDQCCQKKLMLLQDAAGPPSG